MRIPLGKLLRLLLDKLKGTVIKLGPVELELSQRPGPDLKEK